MSSPARRHVQRVALIHALGAGAAAAAAVAKAAARAASSADTIPLEPSPAQAHRMRHAGATSVRTPVAANDNEPSATRAPSPTALIRMDLAQDMRALKEVKSLEAKVARKRELLPKYDSYIEGVIAAAAAEREADPAFRAPQDDVVVRALIWRLDTGDLATAAHLFLFAQDNGFTLGPQFQRDLPCLVAEQAAENVLDAIKLGEPIEPAAFAALQTIRDAVERCDMPDQVRSAIYKAIGLETARQLTAPGAEPNAAASIRAAAIAELTRARQLDPQRAKVDAAIQKLEREAKKAADAAPSDPPPPPAEGG